MTVLEPFPISTLNQKLHRLIPLQEKINALIDFYTHCELLSLQLDQTFLKNYREQLAEARRQWHTHQDFSQYKKLLNDFKTISSSSNIFGWYKIQNKIFLNSDTWLNYRKSQSAFTSRLEIMENEWRRHGRYSHYTSNTLLQAADALSKIDKTLPKVLIKLPKTKRFMEKNSEYATYLTATQQHITTEKSRLSEAMFARLELAITSHDLTNHDVTLNLNHQLQHLQVLPAEEIKNKRPRVKFDSSLYSRFYSYITTHGEKDLKGKLTNLFVMKGGSKIIGIQRSDHPESCIFAPEHLIELIPRKPRKPAWLFKGHQLRYEFFKNNAEAELLLQLVSFSQFKQVGIHQRICFTEEPAWQILKKTQDLLQAAQVRRNATLSTINSRFRKKAHQFIVSWQTLLQQQQSLVLEQQIIFLESVSKSMLTPFNHVFNKPGLDPKTRESISILLSTITSQLNTVPLSTELQKRFERAKVSLNLILENEAEFIQQQRQLQTVSYFLGLLNQNNTLTLTELDELLACCEKIDIRQRLIFNQENSALLQSLLNSVIAFLASQPKQMTDLIGTDQSLWVEQCGKALRSLATPDVTDHLDQAIVNFLTRYQNELKATSPTDLTADCVLFEELEQTVGQLASTQEQGTDIEYTMLMRQELANRALPEKAKDKKANDENAPQIPPPADYPKPTLLPVPINHAAGNEAVDRRIADLRQKMAVTCQVQLGMDEAISKSLGHKKNTSHATNPYLLLAPRRCSGIPKSQGFQSNDQYKTSEP